MLKAFHTIQLCDFLEYAKQKGYIFELYVRPTTTLSGPPQDAIKAGDIVLKFLQ